MSKVVFLLEEGNNGFDGLKRLLVKNVNNGLVENTDNGSILLVKNTNNGVVT
jgi:hypothetical protein